MRETKAKTVLRHRIIFDFRYDGGGLGKGGEGTLVVDGVKVATGRIERTLPFRLSLDETLDCGEDTGTAICDDYQAPFRFTGAIERVVIGIGDERLSAADQRALEAGQAALAAAR